MVNYCICHQLILTIREDVLVSVEINGDYDDVKENVISFGLLF